MKARNPIAWCAIDTLCCLLLVIYVMVAPPGAKNKPTIPTFGSYAVVMTWPGVSSADVDLHIQDPQGQDAYFAASSTRSMNLEHDDIPGYDTTEKIHHERTIIRSAERGEYTVNSHLYYQGDPGSVEVTVTLYRLRGGDKEIEKQTFAMQGTGAEHTAFRFRLNAAGDIVDVNYLQKTLVGAAPQ